MSSTTTAPPPLETSELSDAALLHLAALRISQPKLEPADSFILHAPLELLARTALLSFVGPEARPAARDRIAGVAETYSAAGEAADDPLPRTWDDPTDAVAHLAAAIDAGDLDDADAAAAFVAASLPAEDLRVALADLVIPRLSAAAHGSIFLYHLPRVAARNPMPAQMLRGLVRELARYPDWALTWQEARAGEGPSSDDLVERLLAPTSPGDPGSSFIFPTMSITETSGLAADVLDAPLRSATVRSATHDLLRVAAMAMLQDDPDQAPYGWSHCLTMPQATLGIAPASSHPDRAVAVAATYVLGFRSTLGKVAVDPAWAPEALIGGLEGLQGAPAVAATTAWHTPPQELGEMWRQLATYAATHEDAHLAKYTLACIDATRADQAAAPLFRAAAAFLGAWWRTDP
jgi:hypothetical protein